MNLADELRVHYKPDGNALDETGNFTAPPEKGCAFSAHSAPSVFLHPVRFSRRPSVWAIMGLFSFLTTVAPVMAAKSSDQAVVTWPGQMPTVTVVKGKTNEAVFVGAPVTGEPGQPALPRQIMEVLLPPDAVPRTVTVTIEDAIVEDVTGTWDVLPVPPVAIGAPPGSPVWPQGRLIVQGRDVDTYSTDAFVPDTFSGRIGAGQLRDWRLVEIPISPYRYNPVTKQLQRLKSGNIVVKFSRQPVIKNAITLPGAWADRTRLTVQSRVVNFDEVAPSYTIPAATKSVTGEPATDASVGYVILTTAAIQAGSAQLAGFVVAKQEQGFTVTVATEAAWGGGTGDTAAENIRAWLAANYQPLNLGYVLLIGNPHPGTGDVPMKMTYPQNFNLSYPDCPTDYYYAELTGDWDLDNDGLYGEYDNDCGPGGAERNCEVIVGRIPYYGVMSDLDDILAKIISYGDTPPSEAQWRKKVLLPMEPSDTGTPGYQLGEEIKTAVLIPAGGYTWHRVYDSTYGLSPAPETTPCNVANVTAAWTNSDIGAAFWWTHGSATLAADIMDLSRAAMLDNNHPSFTFQCSCLNSTPEASNNLTYSLLKNGGICTISGTRVTWYWLGQTNFAGRSSNSSMTYEYAKRLVYDAMPSGDALQDLKAAIAPESEPMWMNYVGFNIYGDPATGLYTVLSDDLAVVPATGLNASGYLGGLLDPSNKVYTVSNTTDSNLIWTVECPSNWITIAPTGGTLAAGQTNLTTVTINSNANNLVAGTYVTTVSFSNVNSGTVQTRPVSLTLQGEISFDSDSYTVNEEDGTALIGVHRAGNTNRAVTVDFATSNGTATAGSDYVATNGTLAFAAGDTVKTFTVPILDDSLPAERNETVMLTLSNPTGGSTLDSPISATLTIWDNDVTTLYVSLTGGNVAPYTNWAMAATSIQSAVSLCSSGDVVVVTNGTYNTGSTLAPGGSLPNRVTATNAIVIRSVNGPESTIIQGQGPIGTNAVRGVYLSGNAQLIGFTVENGATGTIAPEDSGGGIVCCGGASVSNCVVRNNISQHVGGGILVTTPTGGSVCNCTIESNWAETGGSGVWLEGTSTLTDCRIIENQTAGAAGRGGGVGTYHLSGKIQNCLVANNVASNGAGGIHVDYGGEIVNCTIAGNVAPSDGGMNYFASGATIRNSIIWGNTGGNGNGGSYTYCATTPLPSGTGNITNNPLFADAEYRLGSGSPCIDAGSNSYVLTTNDLDGNPRIIGGTVDMGAYEGFYYTLTVNSGSGSGVYTNGELVEISADAPASGKTFDRWTGDTQVVDSVTSSTATVTMPTNDVSLTATYINLPDWYTLTVNNGTGDGTYTNGTQVEIAADAPSAGKTFDCWTGDTQYVDSVTSSPTTVTMPASDVSLTATYKDAYYTLIVENGSGDGSYTNGTVVAISADAAVEGLVFSAWTTLPTDYINRLANRLSASTTFTMPTENVSVTATYNSIFTHTTNNGTITITGYRGSGGAVTLPDILNGLPVTSIGSSAFSGCTSLTGLIIPDSVTNIGSYAFYNCSNLTTTTIGNGVKSIGAVAFYSCRSMTNLTFGNHVTTLGTQAFYFCTSLTKLIIPASVTSLGQAEFGDCTNLTDVYFAGNAPPSAYSDIFYITSPGVSQVTVYYLTGTTGWSSTFKGRPTALWLTLTGGSITARTNLQVTVTADIPVGQTFDRWTGDTQYVSSVTSSVAVVSLPAQAISLTATYLPLPPGWYTLTVNNGTGGGAYTNGAQVEIAANAPATGKTFDCWTGDTQHVDSVTSSTARVTIPSQDISLTATYRDAYYTLTVNSGSGSGSYTNGNVVAVSADAAAESLVFSAWTAVPTTYTNRLANRLSASTTFTMPAEDVSVTATYKSVFTHTTNNGAITITGYIGSGGDVIIPSTINGLPVTSIGNSAFIYKTGVTGITIPDSVTSIGYKAFDHAGLTNIVVPASVTNYNNDASGFGYAFGYNPLITATVRGVLIGNNMFQGCAQLTNVVLNENSTAIPVATFLYCSALTTVHIPEAVTSIGSLSFGYSGINDIYIPNGVTMIGLSAFETCTSLTGVYFAGNAPGFTSPVFTSANSSTIYRTSEASGWPTVPTTWAGRPTALWQQNSDTDADGLPDFWEIAHFGSLTNANPTTICANGENTLLQAYIAGLNPNDPRSKFEPSFSSPLMTENVIQWSSLSGRVYSVYFSTNLLNGFQCLETNIPWSANSYTDTVHSACNDGFYWIEVQIEE